MVRGNSLRTVCDSSRCPNISECWSCGTATFMILGGVCTRSCGFCAISHGQSGEALDQTDPERVGRAVAQLGLRHAVVTSVTRDDLDDGGARMFARTVECIRRASPGTTVELLIPDLQGSESALREVVSSRPDILGHNLEVVRRLQPLARDARASYGRSLQVLRTAKRIDPGTMTKTSLMLGLGESRQEVLTAMADARRAGVDLLALGQYLRPKGCPLEVERYLPPEEFAELRSEALEMGFQHVQAGPFVRSSYHAGEAIRGVV